MKLNIIGGIVETVGGFFAKREERKSLEKQIDGKIAMQKENNETQVVFNEQEIDIIAKRNEGQTWKDEYITIIMTVPLITIFLATLFGILLGKPEYMEAASEAVNQVNLLVPNYQELLGLTIVAGLGLRAYKKR